MVAQTPPLQLDPPETKGPNPPHDPIPCSGEQITRFEVSGQADATLSQVFRHSGWARGRARVADSLQRTMQSVSRILSFAGCGDGAYVLKSNENPPRYRVAGSSCHDRFCQMCAQERSKAIALNCLQAIGTQRVRLVTLTLRQQHRPLSVSIDCLYQAFRKLQRLKPWRQRVKAGVGFLELIYKEQTSLWNVHLHLLVTGTFIPKRDLSKWWLSVTGDSMIVNIKLPGGPEGVVSYVTKYASKPLNASYLYDQAALDEAVVALKGRRMCTTFGGWRGVLLVDHPDEEAWENLGSLDDWIRRAADGDEEAATILRQINATRADVVIRTRQAEPRPPPLVPPPPNPQQRFWDLSPIRF